MEHKPAKSSDTAYRLWFSLILGVPIAALIVLSSMLVSEKKDVLLEMDRLHNISHLINRSSDLIHEMQKERGYTSGFIASPKDNFEIRMMAQRTVTDKQYSLFEKEYSSIKRSTMHKGLIENLDLATTELKKLKELRAGVDSFKIGYFDALEYYSKTISLILDTTAFIPQLVADKEISSLYLSYYHLQQTKEKAGLQRATLTYTFGTGKFLPGQFERFLGIVVDESYSTKRFIVLAPPDIQVAFLNVSAMREVAQADWMKQIAIDKGVGGNFGVDAAYWNKMQTLKIDRLDEVCGLLEERVNKTMEARHRGAKYSLTIYLLVNIGVTVFALSMAALLFRNIAKRREAEESLALHARRMENALFRANDVLGAITTSPDIVPFFTVSPVYRSVRSVGGGDIAKWVRFPSQYAGLYLHDVAGHDIEEILLNILAASLVDSCKTIPEKKSASIPSVFLNCLNKHLVTYCEGRPDYLTAIYLLLDFEEREIKMASGGHPRPWLINADGAARQVEMPSGFILGQFNINPATDERYQNIALRLETGQLLLVYSDGLMEQADAGGRTFEAKFTEKIGSMLAGREPRAAHDIVRREFEAHLDGRHPDDDVSFVFIGCRPVNNYKTARFAPGPELLSLITCHKSGRNNDAAPSSQEPASKNHCDTTGKPAYAAIHKLSDSYDPIIEKLKRAQWTEKSISRVELAVSEMVINAIMHGNMCCDRCTVELSYQLHDDELELCVADEGPGFDSKTLPQSIGENMLTEGGRGHHMISAMTDGLYFNDAGNRCWALFKKDASLP